MKTKHFLIFVLIIFASLLISIYLVAVAATHKTGGYTLREIACGIKDHDRLIRERLVTYNLIQITSDKTGLSGSFFLGIGSIQSGENIYKFYIKDNSGKIYYMEAFCKGSTIIEDGGCYAKPNLVEYGSVRDSLSEIIAGYKRSSWEFHLPKNSIVPMVDIGLKR